MDVQHVRIRSWHVVRTPTRIGTYLTLCGRTAPAHADVRDTVPAGRSCESCLRVYARKADR